MYDELVKNLREVEEMLKVAQFKEAANLIDQAADAIEELPKWISVMERLPPAEKEVYVTDGEYIGRANLLDEVFPGDRPCWSYSGLGEITHWCEQIPLPQPLKEECE